jgi:hypothetical protein
VGVADFLAAFAAGSIFGAFAWVDPAGNNFDHFAPVAGKVSAEPELPGEHDLLSAKIDRQNADHDAGPQYLTLESGRRIIAVRFRDQEALKNPKSGADPFGFGKNNGAGAVAGKSIKARGIRAGNARRCHGISL